MRKLAAAIMLSFVLVGSSGCYHMTVRTTKPVSSIQHMYWKHFFLWGIVGIGAETDSPCDPAVVETKQSVVNWLLYAITGGIYTPMTLTITCAAGSAPG
jgi:hypothetical protein